MAEGIARGGSLLLGRRTYEQMASFWPHQSDEVPYAKVINEREKYVASRTLKAPLEWRNSTLLEGDAGDAVAALKEQRDADLGVLGSGNLIQTLMRRDLVDRWVILIHPLVLGAGRRLFPDGGAPASFGSPTARRRPPASSSPPTSGPEPQDDAARAWRCARKARTAAARTAAPKAAWVSVWAAEANDAWKA